MRAHWRPIIALTMITPFLTELLSGNIPASIFFKPWVFLFLATVGYGFPVLLLREFAVRRQLGLIGFFIIGLAYGIYNEGIIAKTFYLSGNVPVKTFNGYGYAFGIAIPWAITISIWHALHSFVYPIIVVSYFFPEHRQSPWLNRRAMVLLAIPVAAVGTLTFFNPGKDRPAGNPAHFILMIVLSCLLLWLARSLKSRSSLGDPDKLRIPAFFLGTSVFIASILVSILLAGAKVPVVVFYLYNLLLVAGLLMFIHRQTSLPINNVLLFALGDDTCLALFGLVGAIGAGSAQRIATQVCFLLVFGWLWMWLRKSALPASR
jgi:hypothetical protein